jgi:small subunit ribosomal protein S17
MNTLQLKSSSFAGTKVTMQRNVAQQRPGTLVVRAAQVLQGKVVSTGNKTTIVAVENISIHPIYSKRVKRTQNHTCHDDKGEAQVGDLVSLKPTRPLSKTKRFIVDDIIMKGN